MDCYIITEMVLPFLFGVVAFSSIGLAVGAVELARRVAESGIAITIALQILLLKMPEYMALALPMATLLSILMVYSRLSNDSELIALRSCGVSIYRLVLPAILMSCVVMGITFGFREAIVPASNQQASVLLNQSLKRERPAFRQENILYQEFREVTQPDGSQDNVLTRIFHAKQFDGTYMKGITILDFSQNGVTQIVVSQRAAWDFAENQWDVFNGTVYVVAPDGSYRSIGRFAHQRLRLPRTPLDLAQRRPEVDQMTISQAQDYLQLLRQEGDRRRIRRMEVRIQQRYAFPFICVMFGLVGAALGTRTQRTQRATGFGIGVVIILAYYLLNFMAGSLGFSGILSPFLAAWLPNFVGLGAGGWLLRRAAR
jgi:lipopolysaccharide export system permease protein